DLPGAADQGLRAHPSVAAAVDAPGRNRRAVVVHGEGAGPGEDVGLLDPGAAAVQAGAAGVLRRDVARDAHRVVALRVLRGCRAEERPPRVAVEPVRRGARGEAPEEEFDELEVLAIGVVPREDEERAR